MMSSRTINSFYSRANKSSRLRSWIGGRAGKWKGSKGRQGKRWAGLGEGEESEGEGKGRKRKGVGKRTDHLNFRTCYYACVV